MLFCESYFVIGSLMGDKLFSNNDRDENVFRKL